MVYSRKMNYHVVNGGQLPNHVDERVSLTGYVNNASVNSHSFEVRSTDDVMVKINLNKPLDRPIEGYVEVHGMYKNKAIYATDLHVFENTEFDAESHNTLCGLLHSLPNLYKSKK